MPDCRHFKEEPSFKGAVHRTELPEGASLAVSSPSSDNDLSPYLVFLYFQSFTFSLNFAKMVPFSKPNEEVFKHVLNSIPDQCTI